VAGVGGRVEEENVDAVGVMGGADGGDGGEGRGGLGPGVVPGHGGGIVDEEDGVEGAEEGVGVVGCGGGGRALGCR